MDKKKIYKESLLDGDIVYLDTAYTVDILEGQQAPKSEFVGYDSNDGEKIAFKPANIDRVVRNDSCIYEAEDSRYITPEQLKVMLDEFCATEKCKKYGVFYTYEDGKYIGVGNEAGDLFIEEFDTFEECQQYLLSGELKYAGSATFENGSVLTVYECKDEYIYFVKDIAGEVVDTGYTDIRDTDVYAPIEYILLWCEPKNTQGSYQVGIVPAFPDEIQTPEAMSEKFIADGWGKDTSFEPLTLCEAKEKGLLFAVANIKKGHKYYKMAVTGNIYDGKGKICFYNIKCCRRQQAHE